ncbi:ketopantoate reductase family protein [Ureibacillus sp. 179-F W5.1 NHS]|uniref:2-dehydropantoate 2-reductase n=1 Tax=Lysinibacillus halotolerans TaxID=1368476 RepID=A0A3M8HHM3_9BACI|nr:2-dehydropantoate 2-reductase [Lysinibacillus halotolerans]RND01611.1 2-dehydropantoate 2-reductase [Lysinibacillus halotolerans]
MDIIVIGAGSVGMLVASFLSECNDTVKLIVRRENQAEQLLRHGLVRKNLDGTMTKTKVQVAMDLEGISKQSIVIIAVKYGELNQIYPILRTIHEDIPLLFLQNGLAHLEEAVQLPQKTIAFGSCQFGAERENDYTIVHRGQGVLKIAMERGTATPFHLFSQKTNELFQVTFVENVEDMLFEKALLNCFINPLTAILRVKNGMLIENPHTYKLLEKLYNELMIAFPEKKAIFPFEEVEKLCRKTAINTSSMLADILHKRPTEIDTIVGAVLKRAAKRGKTLPILTTLYHLIVAIEESGEKM